MLITTKLATFGSIDFPDNFCQKIMEVLGTRFRKLDFLGIAQKVRHFLILVPKTAMISWQKLSGKSIFLNLFYFNGFIWKSFGKFLAQWWKIHQGSTPILLAAINDHFLVVKYLHHNAYRGNSEVNIKITANKNCSFFMFIFSHIQKSPSDCR